MSARRVAGSATSVVLAAAVVLGGCQDDGGHVSDPAPPATASSQSSGDPSPVADRLDTAAVVTMTSSSGPVRFRSDLVYAAHPDTPISRVDGLLDWASSRGAATEWADPGLYGGDKSQGLQRIGSLWGTSNGVVEQGYDKTGKPDGAVHTVDGDLLGMVGWDDKAVSKSGSAGATQLFGALLDGPAFGDGVPEEVDGQQVVHYRRAPTSGAVSDVWVTADGLLVRLVSVGNQASSPVRLVITLSDYGTDDPIDPPPAT